MTKYREILSVRGKVILQQQSKKCLTFAPQAYRFGAITSKHCSKHRCFAENRSQASKSSTENAFILVVG